MRKGGVTYAEWLVILVLTLFTGSVVYSRAERITPLLIKPATFDQWFDADCPHVAPNMVMRDSNHYRTGRHPIFSLCSYPLTKGIQHILRVDPVIAIQTSLVAMAMLWVLALYGLARLLKRSILEAGLMALLGLSSAAATFWLPVPETYTLGSLSMFVPLMLAARSQVKPVAPTWYTLGSAFSLGITPTNWMAGVITTFTCLRWKMAVVVTVAAVAVVVILEAVQKAAFPSAWVFPLHTWSGHDGSYVLTPEQVGSWAILRSFFSHAIVMPQVDTTMEHTLRLSVQASALGSAGAVGTIATVVWLVLLALGAWRLVQTPGIWRWVLGLTVAGQLLLHLVYGKETFLYAMHFAPLLVLVAGESLTKSWRNWTCLGMSVLVVLAFSANQEQFNQAVTFVATQLASDQTLPHLP